MSNESANTDASHPPLVGARPHALRFLTPHLHLVSTFGNDGFGRRAESFARYFGTPRFLIIQTAIVAIWIALNSVGFAHFDIYPFILLNLAFSLQAAYAAPLILLAQTRQSDRDKCLAEADAQHREALANAAEAGQQRATEQSAQLHGLLQQNIELTKMTHALSQRIETMAAAIHQHIVDSGGR